MNITEDYVSFEVAKLLKEKEFNENCFALYNPSEELIQCGVRLNNTQVGRVEGSYSAPTFQMTMKWLREVHKECIVVQPVVTDDDGSAGCLWSFSISKSLELQYKSEYVYELYAAACEAAIKYCLENLI